jgi:hypothetical protein
MRTFIAASLLVTLVTPVLAQPHNRSLAAIPHAADYQALADEGSRQANTAFFSNTATPGSTGHCVWTACR